MLGYGLPPDTATAPTPAAPIPPMQGTIGGMVGIQNVSSLQAERADKAEADAALELQQAQPLIQNLAGHVKGVFLRAEQARLDVQNKMLEALYARRGEYTPDKLAKIIEQGQPPIYMMLPSVKMRQAEALLLDLVGGVGRNRPWSAEPTRVPELPPQEDVSIRESVTQEVQQAILMGLEPTPEDVRQRLEAAKTQLQERLREQAMSHAERMSDKMEDQLQEGGFAEAFSEFIKDLTTFKTAFLAGPIVRRKPRLAWGPDGQPVVTEANVLEWERVDPFDMYPAAWAKNINDGPLVRRHKLTRQALTELRGVEGYSTEAIDRVLDLYGSGGLSSWLSVDSQKARAEGKLMTAATQDSGLIDALQYWGSVSGKMLLEWGMDKASVPDPSKEYQVEAWVIGSYTIKAVLNADPLARRPYYADSYECIPGTVWGNSLYDLMRDCADMCNSSARALAANLGISSGPQVAVNVDRLPPGETVSAMYPWKLWQVTSDPMGSTAKAIDFFQPNSNATELMNVFNRFSDLADEYTGIPKYTVGQESAGGAGRTASGMSMMLSNAGKIIRAVVASIDTRIFTPLLDRLWYYNMRYSDDPDLKGDVRMVARGVLQMAIKESAQVRRNEFLQMTNNPVDLQIMGLEGRAEVLRSSAESLEMNTSRIIPPVAVLKDRQRMQEMQAAAQAQAVPQGDTPAKPGGPAPQPQQGGPSGSGQALMGPGGEAGGPVTDNFQPAEG